MLVPDTFINPNSTLNILDDRLFTSACEGLRQQGNDHSLFAQLRRELLRDFTDNLSNSLMSHLEAQGDVS